MSDTARFASIDSPELEAIRQASDHVRAASDRLRAQAGAVVRKRSAQLEAALVQVGRSDFWLLGSPAASIGWIGVVGSATLVVLAPAASVTLVLATTVVAVASLVLGLVAAQQQSSKAGHVAVLPALALGVMLIGCSVSALAIGDQVATWAGGVLGLSGLATLTLSLRPDQPLLSQLTQRVCGSLAGACALLCFGA